MNAENTDWIKSMGVEITHESLVKYALSLGITKPLSEMTQMEIAQLKLQKYVREGKK